LEKLTRRLEHIQGFYLKNSPIRDPKGHGKISDMLIGRTKKIKNAVIITNGLELVDHLQHKIDKAIHDLKNIKIASHL